MDTYGLQGVDLILEETITADLPDGGQASADGYYIKGLISVALESGAIQIEEAIA